MKNTKLKPDVIFKEFWRENSRFASLFNTVIFEGRKVIRPEELTELDTDVSNTINFGDYKETLTRARDVVKKAAHGVDFVIMGIESQRKTHYGMPLRIMIYDSLGYLKEYQEIVSTHKRSGDKAASEEFLSGIHKDDRLHPIISIVIYYNEKAWDGPKSLKDMIVDMPEAISKAFADYRMNLLQVGESGKYRFDNDDVQTAFEIARYIYQGKFDMVRGLFGDKTVKSDVGAMIGVMTDSDLIVEKALESEGGMNMCTALEKLEEKGREEGREEGKRKMIFAFLKAGAEDWMIKEASGLSDEEIEEIRREMG